MARASTRTRNGNSIASRLQQRLMLPKQRCLTNIATEALRKASVSKILTSTMHCSHKRMKQRQSRSIHRRYTEHREILIIIHLQTGVCSLQTCPTQTSARASSYMLAKLAKSMNILALFSRRDNTVIHSQTSRTNEITEITR